MFIPVWDPHISSSLYMQLYENIRQALLAGKIAAGEKLLSKRLLSSQLGISVNTVDAAYQQLVSEGYLETRPKSGYYACDLGVQAPGTASGAVSIGKAEGNEVPSFDSPYLAEIPESPARVIDFSPNGVDLGVLPMAKIKRTIRDVFDGSGADIFSSCDPQGSDALRRALCRYLRESRGLDCRPEQILIGAGTDYILQLLVQILRTASDISAAAMENPVYNKAYQIFTGLQVQVELIPLDRSGIRMDRLLESTANIVYTTPSHQFPLGIIMPVSRRKELLDWASRAADRFIIEDDYDSEFRYAGRPIPPIGSMDANNRVIYLGTFSKSIAPSVRISYLVLPPILLHAFRKNLSYYNSTITHPDQLVLARFIESEEFERHINRMRTLYRRKRDLFVRALSPYSGMMQISGTDAGLHLLCRVNNGMSEDELVSSAKNAAAKVYGISAYYLTDPDAAGRQDSHAPKSTVLLGYAGLSDEQILQGVAALAGAWQLEIPGSSKSLSERR